MKSERGLTALSRARSPVGTHWPLCCHIRTAMMNPTLNSVRRTVLVKPFPFLAKEGLGVVRSTSAEICSEVGRTTPLSPIRPHHFKKNRDVVLVQCLPASGGSGGLDHPQAIVVLGVLA